MLILIFASLVTVTFLAMRFAFAQSAVRFLVDNYGLDRQKPKRLSRNEIAALKKSILQCRKNNDPFALEALLHPYRP